MLVAFNVNLDTEHLPTAAAIAHRVRERGGGRPGVKALALWLNTRRRAQISMNLTAPADTSVQQAFDAVAAEAARHGVAILDSEIVGLAPRSALSRAVAEHVQLANFRESLILEHQLDAAGIPSAG
jgi:glutamate formiminotransferase